MGETIVPLDMEPFARVNGAPEGVRHERCFGTYLHDSLRSDAVLQFLGLEARERPEPYERLASWFESNVRLRLFEELYL